MRCKADTSAGFTLIEILIVLALGGLLLVAVSSLMFGIVKLSNDMRSQPYFDAHADNCVRFLTYLFETPNRTGTSQQQGGGNAARGQQGQEAGTLAWKQIPGASFADDPVLSITVEEEMPLLLDEEEGQPGSADLYLQFDEDYGLVLHWQSEEITENDSDATRNILVSPLITAMRYLFYDVEDDQWEIFEADEQIDTGEFGVTDFIELEFTSENGAVVTRRILLPRTELAPPYP